MKNIQSTGKLYGKVITLRQISKAKAAKLFADGKEVYLQSCNMLPFGAWQSEIGRASCRERVSSPV